MSHDDVENLRFRRILEANKHLDSLLGSDDRRTVEEMTDWEEEFGISSVRLHRFVYFCRDGTRPSFRARCVVSFSPGTSEVLSISLT